MDPLTILAGIKTGLAAGKTIASLSKRLATSLMQQTKQKKVAEKRYQ